MISCLKLREVMLILVLIVMSLASCDGDGDDDFIEELLPNDLVYAQVEVPDDPESPISLVVTTRDASEAFGILLEKDAQGNPIDLIGAAYISNNGVGGFF